MIDRMLSHRRRPILAVVACSVLGLSACGLQSGATAAEVGDTVITISEVESWVDEYASESGQGDLSGADATNVTRQILDQRIQGAVFEELAAELDIEISESELNQEIAQFRSQINQMPDEAYRGWVAENYTTRDQLTDVLRPQVLAMRIVEQLPEDTDLVRMYDEHDIDVTVNPRFGSWTPETGLESGGGALVDFSEGGDEEVPAEDDLPPVNP